MVIMFNQNVRARNVMPLDLIYINSYRISYISEKKSFIIDINYYYIIDYE